MPGTPCLVKGIWALELSFGFVWKFIYHKFINRRASLFPVRKSIVPLSLSSASWGPEKPCFHPLLLLGPLARNGLSFLPAQGKLLSSQGLPSCSAKSTMSSGSLLCTGLLSPLRLRGARVHGRNPWTRSQKFSFGAQICFISGSHLWVSSLVKCW